MKDLSIYYNYHHLSINLNLDMPAVSENPIILDVDCYLLPKDQMSKDKQWTHTDNYKAENYQRVWNK